MIQSDDLRRLAKALGINAKSSGIHGAISDMADAFEKGQVSLGGDWNTLKNRPFGTKTEMVEIYNDTLIGTTVSHAQTTKAISIDDVVDLKVGSTYIVNVNDKNYNVVGIDNGQGGAYIGVMRSEVSRPNSEPPFNIDSVPDWRTRFTWHETLGEIVKFSIISNTETITPLDYKFMPEGYPKAEKKTIEIVPEQTINGELLKDGEIEIYTSNGGIYDIPKLVIGKTYIAYFNGVKYELVARQGENSNIVVISTCENYRGASIWDLTEGFGYDYSAGSGGVVWKSDFADETITLAIYEEKEVVTPLDPKFMVMTIYVDDDFRLYKDKDLTEQITSEELRQAGMLNINIAEKVSDTKVRLYKPFYMYDEGADGITVHYFTANGTNATAYCVDTQQEV